MINKIFNGEHLTSLDCIKQWSELDGHITESVSQHSFKVSVFVAALVEELFLDSKRKMSDFKYKCVMSGMFHDFDEHYIKRDISHEVKYNEHNGSSIKSAIDNFAKFVATEDLLLNADDSEDLAFEFIFGRIFEVDITVKSVVKVADWLGLLHHLKREKRMGNTTVDKYIEYCLSSFLNAVKNMEFQLNVSEFKYNEEVINKLIKISYGEKF